MLNFIDFDTFQNVEMRVGEITRAEPYPEARKPAIKLWINFQKVQKWFLTIKTYQV